MWHCAISGEVITYKLTSNCFKYHNLWYAVRFMCCFGEKFRDSTFSFPAQFRPSACRITFRRLTATRGGAWQMIGGDCAQMGCRIMNVLHCIFTSLSYKSRHFHSKCQIWTWWFSKLVSIRGLRKINHHGFVSNKWHRCICLPKLVNLEEDFVASGSHQWLMSLGKFQSENNNWGPSQ